MAGVVLRDVRTRGLPSRNIRISRIARIPDSSRYSVELRVSEDIILVSVDVFQCIEASWTSLTVFGEGNMGLIAISKHC